MNPFTIRNTADRASAQEHGKLSAQALLKRHGYNDTIRKQLLETALHDMEKAGTTPRGEVEFPPEDTPPNLHRDILIVPNFLSPEICNEYIEFIKKQQEIDLSVFDPETTNTTGENAWRVDKKVRDTQTVNTDPIQEVISDLMRYAVRDFLNPFFKVDIKYSEVPQVLVYHEGGHYRPHIDGETLFNDGTGKLSWKRNVDRDISMVVYFNDDFEGGELVFPKQAISVKPRAGMLAAFPSNHHFLHGVNPTRNGTRYALVNWFSLGQHPE